MPEYARRRTTEGDPKPKAPVRAVFLVLFGLAAMAVVLNVVVTQRAWHPHLGYLDEKVAGLDRLRDQVDTVFIGTSRVFDDVSPLLFDAETARLGHPTTSFSLAINGMSLLEREYAFQKLKELKLPKLKYIIFEPNFVTTPVPGNVMTTNYRYLLNWKTFGRSLELKTSSSRDLLRRFGSGGMVFVGAVVNTLNYGVLSDVIRPMLAEQPPPVPFVLRGNANEPPTALYDFRVPQKDMPSIHVEREAKAYDLQPPEIAQLKTELGWVRDLGAEPVIVLPPQSEQLNITMSLHEGLAKHLPDAKVLSYFWGQRHPELYDQTKLWADNGHLNAAGEAVFNVWLAHDVLEKLGLPIAEKVTPTEPVSGIEKGAGAP